MSIYCKLYIYIAQHFLTSLISITVQAVIGGCDDYHVIYAQMRSRSFHVPLRDPDLIFPPDKIPVLLHEQY